MFLPAGFDATPFRARRARLRERFAGPLIVDAGRPAPRNYPGNPFPFRASSHFLYLVGLPIDGARLVADADGFALEVAPLHPDDALWHGASASREELAAALDLPVRDPAAPTREAALLLPADAASRHVLSAALGRDVETPSEADLALQDAIIALRLVHDAHAIAELERAAEATVAAHRAGMAATRPGVHEHQIRAAMEAALRARGMGTSYNPIVTTRGEVLHENAQRHVAQAGDLLLADVGAETPGGFAGDVTRTWPVAGTYSATQRTIYDLVLAAHAAAVAACRPGARYRDVHLEACRVLAEGLVAIGILRGDPAELVADGVHALLFPHGVGHLLGLDVHDMEDLGDRAGYAPGRERSAQFGLGYLRLDRDLQPGMAVTIEPGFYQVPAILERPALRALAGDRLDTDELAKFADVRGIRIEDDVLITDAAPRVLTQALGRTAAEVEAAVGAGAG